MSFDIAEEELGMDPISRKQILDSMTNPTNVVPGVVLKHIDQHSDGVVNRWLAEGWIRFDGQSFVLTEAGCTEIKSKHLITPPESFFPLNGWVFK